MKNGIQIEIQKDLNEVEKNSAIEFAKKFVGDYLKDGMKFKGTQGGWHSFYRRGTIGLKFDDENKLYFRRASKHRRIYQIIRECELKMVPVGDEFVTKYSVMKTRWDKNTQAKSKCICPKCSAQIKSVNKYGDIKTDLFCIIGDIKG
jgi:hypothetical protein